MNRLIEKYLPESPKIGLYIAPRIPEGKLRNAIGDFGKGIDASKVRALYDATLMGSAKDGILFLDDRAVYQNNNLEPAQTLFYDDVINVDLKKRFLGGKEVRLDVNRANATVTHTLDFSGQPDAAEYVARLFHELVVHGANRSRAERTGGGTDWPEVQRRLRAMLEEGILSESDYRALWQAARQEDV